MSVEDRILQMREKDDLWECVFVYAIWGGMSLATLAVIVGLGSSIPFRDDVKYVTYIADGGAPSWAWLWHLDEVNRFPVSRFLMWGSFHLFEGDLRPLMVLGFGVVAVAAFGGIGGLRAMRGRQSYFDALVPLALLHLGHAESFLWFMLTVHASLATAAAVVLTIYVFCPRWWASRGMTFVSGLALVILPLQASVGILSAACFVPACGLLGWLVMNRSADKGVQSNGRMLLGAAAMSLVVAMGYGWGLSLEEGHNEMGVRIGQVFIAATQAMSMTFGMIARRLWPLSGLGVLILVLWAFWCLGRQWRQESDVATRAMTSAQLLVLAAPLLMALMVGWGRPSQGALLDRYGFYMAHLGIALYCTFTSVENRRGRSLVQMTLFFYVSSAVFYHAGYGLDLAQARRDRTVSFDQDIEKGLPLLGLVAKHSVYWAATEDRFRSVLESLRRRKIQPFNRIASDPAFDVSELPIEDARVRGFERIEGDAWQAEGRASTLVWSIPSDQVTKAIRFEYRLVGPGNAARMKVSTQSDSGLPEIAEVVVNYNPIRERRRETQTFWIDERVSRFAISPNDRPYRLELYKVERLIQAEEIGP